jgi:hypothetical protein
MKTLQVPIIIYLMEAPRKIFFYLYVGRDFCELVADQTNIHAKYIQRKSGTTDTNCSRPQKYLCQIQRKSGTTDTNWEDTNVDEIRAYMGFLIYRDGRFT